MHLAAPALDPALCAMIDHAISITDADRGSLLLEADSSGSLRVRLARAAGGTNLPTENLAPSQTALRQSLDKRSSVITEDLNLADLKLQGAQSIVAQRLRAVIAIPLYAMPRASSAQSIVLKAGQLLGGSVSRIPASPAAFSKLLIARHSRCAFPPCGQAFWTTRRICRTGTRTATPGAGAEHRADHSTGAHSPRLPRLSLFRVFRDSHSVP